MSDKLMYSPMLAYMAWRGWLDPVLLGLFLAFDITGQFFV